MEADWEFELGGDAPVIEAYWPGFVNVRDEPWRVDEIAETLVLPGLASALSRLNCAGSPVWTCKTDVFVPEQFDPDELAASPVGEEFGVACYLDMLMRGDRVWNSPGKAEEDCRNLCAGLRAVPLRCCRVDLVVRQARVADVNDLGATVYLTACGPTFVEAKHNLADCLAAVVQLITAQKP